MSLALSSLNQIERQALALADERVNYNWNELNPILNRAANALASLDFDTRRVAIFAQNSAETVISYVACIEAGISSVPVSYQLKSNEVSYILSASNASALLVGPETLEVGLVAAQEAGIKTVIGWRCEPNEKIISWEDFLANANDEEPPLDTLPLPHLHFTSGTTGTPKATQTPPQYFPAAKNVEEFAKLIAAKRTPSPGLVVGPLYHTGPLGMARNLFGGGSLVVMEHFDALKVLENIERYKIAGSVMVPTHFQRLLSLPIEVRNGFDLSSMQRLAHTGASCPREVKKQMIDWFGEVLVEAYGGTEAGSTTFITSPEWLKRPGSVGRALAPYETLIIGEDGKPLGANQEGQVYFRDSTGRGIIYDGDPEKTASAHIAAGVFTLGEVGYVDEEGYLFITDRVSDMIVSGGVNIYPAEAEQVLIHHPQVSDVAVLAAPNKEMGEEVKALIVPLDIENPPSAEELNAFCREKLAGYKCPRSYDFVADIGRNAMGKINKKQLRQRFWTVE